MHRSTRRLIVSAKKDGTYVDTDFRGNSTERPTWTVVYLDHIDGHPDTESGVLDEDLISAVNSYDIALVGDWFAHTDSSAAVLSRKKAGVQGFADSTAEFRKGIVGSADKLVFGSWDLMVAWSAAKGIAVRGWAPDRFGSWVPVGDRRCTSDVALTPCAEFGCDRVGSEMGTVTRTFGRQETALLCKMHMSHANRREAREAERAEAAEERRAQAAEVSNRRAAAQMWAQRLRDEFGVVTASIDGSAYAGKVSINPEGLYGLLVSVAAELRELEIDVTDLVPAELRVRQSDDSE